MSDVWEEVSREKTRDMKTWKLWVWIRLKLREYHDGLWLWCVRRRKLWEDKRQDDMRRRQNIIMEALTLRRLWFWCVRRRKTKWCENSESWWRLWPWDDLKTELFPTELTKIDQKKAYWSLMTENGNQNRSWKVSKDHDSGSDSERTRKQNLSKDHDFSSDSERTRRRNLTKDHDSGSNSERTRRRNQTKDKDSKTESDLRSW